MADVEKLKDKILGKIESIINDDENRHAYHNCTLSELAEAYKALYFADIDVMPLFGDSGTETAAEPSGNNRYENETAIGFCD